MALKYFVFICVLVAFRETTSAQCINGYGSRFDSLPNLYGNLPGTASSGGGFFVTSTSPIAPTGLSVVSENAIEGALSMAGELPFLGAVRLEGCFPSVGAGSISYGCGNGALGIWSEGPLVTGIVGSYGPVPALGCGYNLQGAYPGY